MNSNPPPIYLVAFCHLDLFWAGTREECLSRGNLIIRRALDLIEDYPEFNFMIETVNFIEHYLECFPEERERIVRHAADGRLEFIPMRSGIYSHLPAGETTIRNLLYGTEFCENQLGISPKIMSISDIPGAVSQLPQIVKKSGMDMIVVSRGFPKGVRHFKWDGLDGTNVKAYCPYHYDTFVNIFTRAGFNDFDQKETEKKLEELIGQIEVPEMMHYGTDLFAFNARILDNIRTWNQSGKRPLKFSTFKKFFDMTTGDVPTLHGEAPDLWPNLDSSWPDLWPLDLGCERELHLAEYFKSMNILAGNKPADDSLKEAWNLLLDSMDHNQNGIGGDKADEDKLDLKLCSRHIAQNLTKKLSWKLVSQTTVPHQFAFPIVIFNELSWTRSGLVSARTALYGETMRGLLRTDESFRLISQDGKEVPFKTVCRRQNQADTIEIEFFADKVPALGGKVWFLEPGERKTFPVNNIAKFDQDIDHFENPRRNMEHDYFENDHFTLKIDRVTGTIDVHDKVYNKPLFDKMAIIGVEERRAAYIDNMTPSGRVFPAQLKDVRLLDNNAVFMRVEVTGKIYDRKFTQIITLPANAHEIEIDNTIDWFEESGWVRIEQTFPFADDNEAEIRYGSPFGQERFPETVFTPDIPEAPCDTIRMVRLWADIGNKDYGVTIGADHREWEFDSNMLYAYMVRGIGWCTGAVEINDDQTFSAPSRPPAGKYNFKYKVCPHAATAGPAVHCGWELNFPLKYVAASDTTRQSNTPGLELPAMPDCTNSSVVISSVKPAENTADGVIFRAFESSGTCSTLGLPSYSNRNWVEVNMLEKTTSKQLKNEVKFAPFEIKTLLCCNK